VALNSEALNSEASDGSVFVDYVIPRTLLTDVTLIVAGAGLVAIFTYIAVPSWPVPLTLQTSAVLVVAMFLGAGRGMLAIATYVVIGVLGVPVFAGGTSGNLLALPTGGYILGFVAAAGIVGLLALYSRPRSFVSSFGIMVVGSSAIYVLGLPWLGVWLANLGPSQWHENLGYDSVLLATLGTGLIPFIIGDIVDAAVAAAIVTFAWRVVKRSNAIASENALLP
jgi:biotin transport system substrate-specific component